MVGPEGLERLRNALVAVAGCGAVGSYAIEALARAGVGRLRIVDFDVVQESNINRQILALTSTLGEPKVEVARRRVEDINPDCVVEPVCAYVARDTMDEVLAGPPDLVLDAIDTVTPKTLLIASAVNDGIPICSSMGAALRTDPSRIRIGLISETSGCPLARAVRAGLRKRGVTTGIPCVFSTEPANKRFLGSYEPIAGGEHGRRRALASLPTLTGIFGLTLANLALQMLLGDLFPSAGGSPLHPSGVTR
jgi:tRNA A37 threonylcarbamoyladenosine dehydratase